MTKIYILPILLFNSCSSTLDERPNISVISKTTIEGPIAELLPKPKAAKIILTSIKQIHHFINRKKPEECLTRKYSGNYQFGEDTESSPNGYLTVYPDTDTTLLFYIDLCRGAPSYNLGQAYDRAFVNNKSKNEFSTTIYGELGCILHFYFESNKVEIQTDTSAHFCPDCFPCNFGNAVYADHRFKKVSNKIPESFLNQIGDTIQFNRFDYFE